MLEGKKGVFAECGRTRQHHVDMTGLAALRILDPNDSSDQIAPIPTLRDVLRVSQSLHQLMTSLGVLCQAEASAGHSLAETKIGQRWGYDVKGRAITMMLR